MAASGSNHEEDCEGMVLFVQSAVSELNLQQKRGQCQVSKRDRKSLHVIPNNSMLDSPRIRSLPVETSIPSARWHFAIGTAATGSDIGMSLQLNYVSFLATDRVPTHITEWANEYLGIDLFDVHNCR